MCRDNVKMDNISRKFARFSVQVRFEALSAEQVENLKLFILDWIGSAYAGSKERPVKIMSGLVKAFGRTPDSTIIPLNLKGPCLFAALVNGASSHVVEMDDLHRESVLHPAAAILPAVFAAAEREKVSGR
ncbi:MAG TPA: MmgE/PrpD family protein, partial [Desulfobacterales bacterium]|nr:MmgE/PrpD family protein [Desulfobacterales bacterium]